MFTRDDVRGFAESANEIRAVKIYGPEDAGKPFKYSANARLRSLTLQDLAALAAANVGTDAQLYSVISQNDSQPCPGRYWIIEDQDDGTVWKVQFSRRTASNVIYDCACSPVREAS